MKLFLKSVLYSVLMLFAQMQSSFAEANFVNKPIMPVFIDMISPASPFHKKDNIRFIDFLQTNRGKTVFIKSDLSFGTPLGENPEFADKYGLTDKELKLIGKKQIPIPIPINYNEPLNYIILHLLDNNELIFSSGGTGVFFTNLKGAFDVKYSVTGSFIRYHLQERALSYTEEKDIINYIDNNANKMSESQNQNLPIEILNNNSDFIFPDSDINLIEQNELKHLNLATLWQARNEIYARHGYHFKSQKALDFFKKFSWYTPNNSVKINLSEIEKNNVSRIKKIEEKLQAT